MAESTKKIDSWNYLRLTIVEQSYDTANNKSTVYEKLELVLPYSNSSFNSSSTRAGTNGSGEQWYGTVSWRGSQTKLLAEATYDVPHEADGSKSYTTSGYLNAYIGSWSLSCDITLTKINRYAVTNSVEGSDVEGNFKVNYTKYIDSYKYKLRIFKGNTVLERIDYNTSGATFTLSNETIETIYSQTTTSNTVQLGFAVETWNNAGTTKLSNGSAKTITARIANANPIFTDFDIDDINPTTVALTGSTTNNVINVNGFSNIKATITSANKAVAQKGASMTKYKMTIGTATTDIAYSSDSEVYGTINEAVNGVVNIYAIDSRTNSTLKTKMATAELAYTPIYIDKQSSSLTRDDNRVGDGAILNLSGTFWGENFGLVSNSVTTVSYRLKKTTESQWHTGTTTITPTISGNSFSFTGLIASDNQDTTWDLNASYNVEVTVEDELTTSNITFVLGSAVPTMCLDKDGVGVLTAYDSSIGGSLQVGGDIYILDNTNGNISIKEKLTTTMTTDANGWIKIDNPLLPYIEYYKVSTFTFNMLTGTSWVATSFSNFPVGLDTSKVIYVNGEVDCSDGALRNEFYLGRNNVCIRCAWLYTGSGYFDKTHTYRLVIKELKQ